jgi:Zn-dependent peptidase ImmA (M78 family)
VFELFEEVLGKFRPYEVGLPRLTEAPNIAAKITRSALGFSPDSPIADLVRRLERNGVVVIALPYPIRDHDAFSLWADTEPRKPVIVVTSGKPGDRMRFSIAHELGHLVLHRGAEGSRSELEKQADEFAAEFLMPREAIRKELFPPVTLSGLVELKKRWGVSMQALVVRARDLDVITERQYKYLFQQMGSHGWRIEEPVFIPAEKPRLLRKMIEVIYGLKFDVAKVADLLGAPTRLLEQVLDCYDGPPGHGSSNAADPAKVIRFRSSPGAF